MKQTARSGCKLNWFLKVTGKRPDGYHTIATLFQHLKSPSDEIELDFDAAPGIRVCCDASGLPQDLDNLAGKAALAYAEESGIEPAWHIAIAKGIPAAAGLGGGSADAGTVLRLLEEHYHALGREKLRLLAAKIGADVPFFLEPGLVLARGIGEELSALPMPEKLPELLIVNPGFPVSAKWAYCNLEPQRISPADEEAIRTLIRALQTHDVRSAAEQMHNDLEYALYEKFPLLEVIRKELYQLQAERVLVSGSGSSLYAVFSGSRERKNAAETIRKLFADDPGFRIFELGEDCIE